MAANRSEDDALGLLRDGEMEMVGLLPYASNATFLVEVRCGSDESFAVYKPRRGERPLWDFPSGTLCLREYAAYVVDRALGWHIVPPTVLRDGPAGFGALQLFVDEDEEVDVRALPETHPDGLRRIALFDVVVNNTDRKAGHLIVDRDGKLWGVDHGICFSAEPKLRTVVWAYEDERVEPSLVDDLERLRAEGFPDELGELIDPEETDALCGRIEHMIGTKRYPAPGPGGRHVPWPPW